jgi:hypothetical protein
MKHKQIHIHVNGNIFLELHIKDGDCVLNFHNMKVDTFTIRKHYLFTYFVHCVTPYAKLDSKICTEIFNINEKYDRTNEFIRTLTKEINIYKINSAANKLNCFVYDVTLVPNFLNLLNDNAPYDKVTVQVHRLRYTDQGNYIHKENFDQYTSYITNSVADALLNHFHALPLALYISCYKILKQDTMIFHVDHNYNHVKFTPPRLGLDNFQVYIMPIKQFREYLNYCHQTFKPVHHQTIQPHSLHTNQSTINNPLVYINGNFSPMQNINPLINHIINHINNNPNNIHTFAITHKLSNELAHQLHNNNLNFIIQYSDTLHTFIISN